MENEHMDFYIKMTHPPKDFLSCLLDLSEIIFKRLAVNSLC